ncbi:MAG: adenylate kinase [Actinomycetota bacterium]|nr:adenylate kinase [Actinomycetota bacterium]
MASAELRSDTRRILVYGVTGSGKTWLAEQLSRVTGIEWHAVDDLTWEPGWVAVPMDEQRRRIEAICSQPEWILDSAYGDWLDIPLAHSALVVALDYPRWFSLQRLLRRTVARLVDRQPTCNGNRETLRELVKRDSIIVWHFTSFSRKHRRIARWTVDPAGPSVVRLTSARQTETWLAGLGSSVR